MSSYIKKRLVDAVEIGKNIDVERKHEKYEKHKSAPLKVIKVDQLSIGDENGVYCIAVHPDRNQVVAGLGSGCFCSYDCVDWKRNQKKRVESLPLLSIKFYPCLLNDTLFTAGSSGMIKVWDLQNYELVDVIEEPGNEIMSLDFTSDGAHFATGGKDSSVRVYDSEKLILSRLYGGKDPIDINRNEYGNIPGHSQKVLALKFHPNDRNVLISAGWDHSLKIWDIRSEYAVQCIRGPFVCGDGLDILGNYLLTASWKAHNALDLWDYRMASLRTSLTYPTNSNKGEYLYCARFWDEENVIAGGSGTDDLKIINVTANKVVATISGNSHPVQAVEIMKRNNLILCGTTGNVLKAATMTD